MNPLVRRHQPCKLLAPPAPAPPARQPSLAADAITTAALIPTLSPSDASRSSHVLQLFEKKNLTIDHGGPKTDSRSSTINSNYHEHFTGPPPSASSSALPLAWAAPWL